MKIVEETHTRLKIQHRPVNEWCLGGFLCIVFFGLLIYSLFFEYAAASLSCQRVSPRQINCDLQRSSLLGRRERLKIFDISNAYVKSRRSRRSTYHEVVIQTPIANRSMVPNQSHQDNQRVADEINRFVTSNQPSLLVQQNQRNYLFFKKIFFLGVIIYSYFLITQPISNCSFYKSLNKLYIERQSLRGKKIIEEPLDNILCVEIRDKRVKRGTVYQAVIILKSEGKIPINTEYLDENTVRNTVFRINYFLSHDPKLF
jgi:hypothetical protein